MTNQPDFPDSMPEPTLGARIRHRLQAYLLTGIIVAAPILITYYVIASVITTIDDWVRPLLPDHIRAVAVPGLGVLAVLLGLILLGAVTANFAGRFLVEAWEEAVARLPLVRTIYRPLKQVFVTLMTPGSASFREVVLVEYPRDGIWVYGFVSAPLRDPDDAGFADAGMISVYLPTSPNLYAGYLILIARDRLRPTSLSVDEAIRRIASAGLAG